MSVLDGYQEQIILWLEDGISKAEIARRLEITRGSLYYWLETRGFHTSKRRPIEPHPLLEHAECAVKKITASVTNVVYAACAQEMKNLELAGAWSGNGHHAAQSMRTDIMEKLAPILKVVVHAKVMR